MPWIALGTLVVMNDERGSPATRFSTVNTFQYPIGVVHVWVGLQGSLLGPKVVKIFFPKLFLGRLRCSSLGPYALKDAHM